MTRRRLHELISELQSLMAEEQAELTRIAAGVPTGLPAAAVKSVRLIVTLALEDRYQLDSEQLAAVFGVNVRTVQRDRAGMGELRPMENREAQRTVCPKEPRGPKNRTLRRTARPKEPRGPENREERQDLTISI